MRSSIAAFAVSLAVSGMAADARAVEPRLPKRPLLSLSAGAAGGPVAVAGATAPAELLTFAPGLAAGLLVPALGEEVRVTGWPVAPGERADVVLTRRDVYAPGAVIWEVGPEGVREVPRSSLVFLWGEGEHDPGVHVLASVDPQTGDLRGVAFTASGVYETKPAPSEWAGGGGKHLLAPHDTVVETDGLRLEETSWTCAQPELHEGYALIAAASGSPRQLAAPAITSLHTATIAVDTDNELMALKFFDNSTNATNYLADLFAVMNVIYERDLLVRLLQGTTLLRLSSVGDPYVVAGGIASTAHLNEVAAEWQNPFYTGIPRALVMMLSGKSSSTSSSSGIARLDRLCNTTQGFSYTQVFRSPGSGAVSDGYVVPHELGHNFGSPHTHCYSPPVDNCYNSERGCYGCYNFTFVNGTLTCHDAQRTLSCPAPQTINGVANVTGTLMSYCHLSGLGGCSASRVFHPTAAGLLAPLIEEGVGDCVFPLFQVTGVVPNSGLETGGQSVTITGADFDAADPDNDVTVTFGGSAATIVDIPNSTTIQVMTPAHATGTVAVTVTNPGGSPTATRPNAFFYAPDPAPADLHTVTPCRILDTRVSGGALAPGQQRAVQIGGICGIPPGADVIAVAANVTVVGPTAGGFLSLYPGNAFFLGTSTMNFSAGQTRANNVTLVLATNGDGDVLVLNGSGGLVHVIIDANGYYLAPP